MAEEACGDQSSSQPDSGSEADSRDEEPVRYKLSHEDMDNLFKGIYETLQLQKEKGTAVWA